MFKKFFTPKEANRRLPLVRKIVADILDKGKLFRKLTSHLEAEQFPLETTQLKDEIENLVKELEELGCFYKDWNFTIGLVDFPSIIEGEVVFLCWKADELKVSWYHPIDSNYSGRMPIPRHMLLENKSNGKGKEVS